MGSVPTTRPAAEKRSPKPALQFREATKQFRTRRFAGPTSHAEQLQQLRMVHLTDMHVGRVTPMKFQYAAVELTNRAKPDLVAITGDFVCHSQRYLDALIDVVRRIDAPVAKSMRGGTWSANASIVYPGLRNKFLVSDSDLFTTLGFRCAWPAD